MRPKPKPRAPANRIHAYSRWPLNLHSRIAMAETDIAFAEAMVRIMGQDADLTRIFHTAWSVKIQAMDKLNAIQ